MVHAMTVRLHSGVYDDLRRLSFDKRLPMNTLINVAVAEFLNGPAGGSVADSVPSPTLPPKSALPKVLPRK